MNFFLPLSSSFSCSSTGAFTCLASHPTRPELLLTGSNEGYVALWDRRVLGNGAIRTERKHKKASTSLNCATKLMYLLLVRSLKFHDTSPGFVYSCGDDNVVLRWDFNAKKSPLDKVRNQ